MPVTQPVSVGRDVQHFKVLQTSEASEAWDFSATVNLTTVEHNKTADQSVKHNIRFFTLKAQRW